MKVLKISSSTNFKQEQYKQHEFIDYFSEKVKNKRDVDDCIAIPRGIFKAYIYLMAGSSCMLSAAALPAKWKVTKTILNIGSAILSAISAVYFAKPFALKGLSPTVTRDDVDKMNNKQ